METKEQKSKNKVVLEINGVRHVLIRKLGNYYNDSKIDALCKSCSLKEFCGFTSICTKLDSLADFENSSRSNDWFNCFKQESV